MCPPPTSVSRSTEPCQRREEGGLLAAASGPRGAPGPTHFISAPVASAETCVTCCPPPHPAPEPPLKGPTVPSTIDVHTHVSHLFFLPLGWGRFVLYKTIMKSSYSLCPITRF